MENKTINIWKYPNLVIILEYLYINGRNSISNISFNVGIVHSNSSGSLKLLKEMDLVKSIIEGRRTYYELTELGDKVGKSIRKINELLNKNG